MSKIEIIPAIDIIDGKCVRLSQGDYGRKKTYDASPVEMARLFADCGVKRLHVVDLDGAKSSAPVNLPVLERLSLVDGLSIEWGGGIKSDEALRSVFDAGASFAVVGSVAARNPDLFREWLEHYGGERMVLGADITDGKIATEGWLKSVDSGVEELVDKFINSGLKRCIVTDISRDGMLSGPSTALYVSLQEKYPEINFTVSGGISSESDIIRLNEAGFRSVIVGKAIYENLVTPEFIKEWSLKE